MAHATLSVCLIVRNEADNIDACLDSVAWADEVVVIDSGSTDDTVERARRRGAKVAVEADWQGFGIQRQRAQALATGDWILMIDADERASPELAERIRAVVRNDDRSRAYALPRLSWCFGRFIRHGGWYPDYVLRLYPRDRGRYTDALVHEKVQLDPGVRVERLKGDLLHYTYESMHHYLVKSAQYAEAWAEQRQRQGRASSLFQGVVHAVGCFVRMYIVRAGFLDGRAGFLLALLSAHSTFVKYADLWVRLQGFRPDQNRGRVLELCLSDGHGGLELYVSRLYCLLRERGIDCTAMVAPGTLLAQRLAEKGLPYAELKVVARALPLVAAHRLARFLERERIDVVHIHWSKDLPLAALAKRLCARPVRLIHSRHMHITRPKRDPYHRFIYGAVDHYVVLSKVMLEDARRFLPLAEDDLRLVHLGVPASAPHPPAADRGDGILRVGQFSRIERPKGQHLLIEAIDQLRARGITVHARIIGYPMDADYLASLKTDVARRGLDAQVEFRDFHPAPQEIMPEFDVIVLASERETFGLVLVEAMRSGVAVVGTRAGGVPEIIEHGESGLLFEPGSASSLAAALQRLAEDPDERRRLAAAGRERADRLFSEEVHVSRIASLLMPGVDAPQSRG